MKERGHASRKGPAGTRTQLCIWGWTSSQSSTCSSHGPVCLVHGQHPPVWYPTGPPPASSAATQVSPPQGSLPLASQTAAQQVYSTTLPSQVQQLLREFPGLLLQCIGTPHPKHSIEHVIETTGPRCSPRLTDWTQTNSALPRRSSRS